MSEEWRDIAGYEGMYQVSDMGRVRSLSRISIDNRRLKERILRAGSVCNYKYVVLYHPQKQKKSYQVHVLVMMSFKEFIPFGHRLVVDHIDRNKSNNRLSNLQIITNRENCIRTPRGLSKFPGVNFHKRMSKWRARIQINGKRIFLGNFDSEEQAYKAYQKALNEIRT